MVYASSMSSSGGPMVPICQTWSMTLSLAMPTSSAATAILVRSCAIRCGPSGQVKLGTCKPSSTTIPSGEWFCGAAMRR